MIFHNIWLIPFLIPACALNPELYIASILCSTKAGKGNSVILFKII